MKAELCPVCRGSGTYPVKQNTNVFGSPSNITNPQQPLQGKPLGERKCHGCDGKGWILIQNDNNRDDFFPPPYSPPHHRRPPPPPFPFGPNIPPRRFPYGPVWCKGYQTQTNVRYKF